MKKIICYAFLCAFIGVSCKKGDSNNTAPAPAPDPYMTVTPGTIWNYKTHDNVTGFDTSSTLTSTNKDTLLGGRNYHMFSDFNIETAQTDTAYYNVSGNDYYQMSVLSPQLAPFELKYLSDNAPVNSSWNTPFSANASGATITASIVNTIVEKGSSLTIGTRTYINVIKVRTDIQNANISIPLVGSVTPSIIQNVFNYYAPKYGRIKSDYRLKISANIPLSGLITLIDTDKTTTLISSTIQ